MRAEAQSATVEVPMREDFQSRDCQFTVAFPACSAEIELRTTPIRVEFAWESQLPGVWRAIWSDPANFPGGKLPAALSEDAFYRCEFYAKVNGEPVRLPVYYNSGEHPQEEVLFELN